MCALPISEALFRDHRESAYLLADNVSYTFGNHHLRFGGDIQRYRIDYTTHSQSDPQVTFGGQVTGVSGQNNAGNAFADFLLGSFTTFKQQSTAQYVLYDTF